MSRMPLERARARMSILWFLGAGVISVVMIILSVADYYQDQVADIWGWLLPLVIPTLALMISVLGANALKPDMGQIHVSRFFFNLAFWVSTVYLLLILLMIIIEPASIHDTLEFLNLSNYWLAPMQGLAASAIGALFYTKQEGGKK